MKTFIRLFALLSALVILFGSVISCNAGSDNNTEVSTTTQGNSTTSTTAQNTITTEPSVTTSPSVTTVPSVTTTAPMTQGTVPQITDSSLPLMDWEGDVFYVLGYKAPKSDSYHLENFEIWRDKGGDVVGESIWQRNENVKKKYNFVVEHELVSNPYKEIQTLYDAQDDLYDLVIYRPNLALNHASTGYLINLHQLNYINTDHIAWNRSVNNDLSLNGSLYFTTNYFLLQDKAMTSALLYNDTLARSLGITDVKERVLNGKWTVEYFNVYTKNAQIASSNKKNEQFVSLVCDSTEFFASFFYGVGATLTSNKDGRIEITNPSGPSHRIDALAKTMFDPSLSKYPVSAIDNVALDFVDGNALFYATYVYKAKTQDIGNMKDQECLIPYPKYVDEQDYYSFVSPTSSSVFAIPYTVADPDQVGYYIQAISEEAVNTSYQTYFQSALPQTSDEMYEAKMLDMILSSQKFDIAASLNPAGVYEMISKQIPDFRTNVYERLFNTKNPRLKTELDTYLGKFQAR